jgi:hypothetical protein
MALLARQMYRAAPPAGVALTTGRGNISTHSVRRKPQLASTMLSSLGEDHGRATRCSYLRPAHHPSTTNPAPHSPQARQASRHAAPSTPPTAWPSTRNTAQQAPRSTEQHAQHNTVCEAHSTAQHATAPTAPTHTHTHMHASLARTSVHGRLMHPGLAHSFHRTPHSASTHSCTTKPPAAASTAVPQLQEATPQQHPGPERPQCPRHGHATPRNPRPLVQGLGHGRPCQTQLVPCPTWEPTHGAGAAAVSTFAWFSRL